MHTGFPLKEPVCIERDEINECGNFAYFAIRNFSNADFDADYRHKISNEFVEMLSCCCGSHNRGHNRHIFDVFC